MQYTDEYFGDCNDVFNDLMTLKDKILLYRRNDSLSGNYVPDPIDENGYTYYNNQDPFTEEFNLKDEIYAQKIEDAYQLRGRKKISTILDNFRKNVILYSTLVDSKVFKLEMEERIKRGDDLLSLIEILKTELQIVVQGYVELSVPIDDIEEEVTALLIPGESTNEPPEAFAIQNRPVYNVIYATNPGGPRYQPKRSEIVSVPDNNVLVMNPLIESRTRNSKTRRKKVEQPYVKLGLNFRRRTNKTREAKKRQAKKRQATMRYNTLHNEYKTNNT